MPEPFVREPFESLPGLPRVPHPYFGLRTERLEVTTTQLGRVSTHVRVHGSGPPLLLIHGLMTSSYSFRYVFEPLGRHFTVYGPDLPGAGRSDHPLWPRYTPTALARWIGELQRRLGIYGCDVIGNSMGGYLAMTLALLEPDAMRRLVNLHSPGVPLVRLHALAAAMAVPGARHLTAWLARRNPERWVHRNVHYYDETLKSIEEAEEYGTPLATRAGSMALAKYLAETLSPSAMRRFENTLHLRAAFPVPLLLWYARRDPMVPPLVGRRLAAALPSAELVWLEQASHFAHVDAPERFLAPTLRFLQ
ncbi:MAG TPA: alpha/beta hydrolase [Kofleriaceae bacterium]|nr:alpha/beta hydrolase [Kofleriaceae bacterium]